MKTIIMPKKALHIKIPISNFRRKSSLIRISKVYYFRLAPDVSLAADRKFTT